jgi:NAD(P)-dependent dehydrogenase (short-subunit alcohol dehydrogenase family)
MKAEKNKRVVITGATRGLGRALVAEFIRQGHIIAGCGRTTKRIHELRVEFGGPHTFDVVDVADDPEVELWAKGVIQAGCAPDLLINNAALINRRAPLWEVPAEEFSKIVDVNLKGVVTVIRHFLPPMIRRGTGVVVNFSSGWGHSTDAEVTPYCATKWAIEGLTQALAQELPAGLAAIPLNPGIIDTEMLRSCFGPSAASYPAPDTWAREAVPLLLRLGPSDNGRPLTAPGG